VAISSASIPAVTFVITANLPARRHRRNEAINEAIDGSGPGLPMTAVKKVRPNRGAIHSQAVLQLIRNCKNEPRTGCRMASASDARATPRNEMVRNSKA
jgi:hypothetical protein